MRKNISNIYNMRRERWKCHRKSMQIITQYLNTFAYTRIYFIYTFLS